MAYAIGVLIFLSFSTIIAPSSSFELVVLHNNDVHSYFEQFQGQGSICQPKDEMENKCYGGIPRLMTKVNEIRKKELNTLFLNAGDFYQGTIYYTLLKYKPVLDFMNLLDYTAMSLGNHEFDDGVAGLHEFVKGAKFKVLAANVDVKNEPKLNCYIHKSTIVDIKGVKIGIIGYLTEKTYNISSVDNTVRITDVIESVKAEAIRLTDKENIDHLIAVGHAGFEMDQELCRQVPQLDIVVGGHTNTFLYTGTPPLKQDVHGPYPTIIQNADRLSLCLVVQDYTRGQYLGHLKVKFDHLGRVQNYSGNPILLDHKICKELRECSFGNLLTDAFVYYFKSIRSTKNEPIYAINIGGSIGASINKGKITMAEVLSAVPYDNIIKLNKFSGKTLKTAFENAISKYNWKVGSGKGHFLQVSGFKVAYQVFDVNKARVALLCAINKNGKYEPVEDDQKYTVAAPNYILRGKDGYTSLLNGKIDAFSESKKETMILQMYLKERTPIKKINNGRIKIIFDKKSPPTKCSEIP